MATITGLIVLHHCVVTIIIPSTYSGTLRTGTTFCSWTCEHGEHCSPHNLKEISMFGLRCHWGSLVLHCHLVLLLLKAYFSIVFTPAAVISGVTRVGGRCCSG